MKTCSLCKLDLSLNQFAFVNKQNNTYHSQCNQCRRATAKKSYQKHKDKVVSKVVERGRGYRKWFRDLKSKLSCCVCGESDSVCLDFHHLDTSEKDFELAGSISRVGKKTILNELSKCACLCANCHRKVHAGRLNTPLVKLDITQVYEI